MSDALWFAEGFTNYFDGLTMCRAGITDPQSYVIQLENDLNAVWIKPGLKFGNPLSMSQQAVFVDAATAIDPNNRGNTFISYYTYGNAIALALDLELRKRDLNLDDYMTLVWNTYGRSEIPYKVSDLETLLNAYAGEAFGTHFFESYIYNSEVPDMKALLGQMGIHVSRISEKSYFGASLTGTRLGSLPLIGSPAYEADLDMGDRILAVNGIRPRTGSELQFLLELAEPGETVVVEYERFGKQMRTNLTLKSDDAYRLQWIDDGELSEDIALRRKKWLSPKASGN